MAHGSRWRPYRSSARLSDRSDYQIPVFQKQIVTVDVDDFSRMTNAEVEAISGTALRDFDASRRAIKSR